MSDDEGLSIYDEVEIEDMTFDEAMGVYQFPCPCGDKFQITLEDLLDEQDIAVCPSCSLMIRVIFDLTRHDSHPSAVSTTPFEELEASVSNPTPVNRPQLPESLKISFSQRPQTNANRNPCMGRTRVVPGYLEARLILVQRTLCRRHNQPIYKGNGQGGRN
ncbi:hypothetical protein IWW34DRAFT_826587 [Fusarium oxysporum f. sp. albedinis]|nr:hypothetical protein BKA60DRAFT_617720 [Fusarium oxysporum]KAI3588692.1 hypothetical protein IWW34DRAFT_826587 [Fusarium oxysporum f. sp. albedinis]